MKVKNNFGECSCEIKKEYVHIFNLYVSPKYRNKGHAKELLILAIRVIHETGYFGEIQIVADPNERGINKERLKTFYAGLGLRVFDYYG